MAVNPTVDQMRRAIEQASKSAGMKAPVVANKPLTGLKDFHQSLGDRIQERVGQMKDMMDSTAFKYDVGHHVFTKGSAAKNQAPYKILSRTMIGNAPMRHPAEEGKLPKAMKDSAGKTMRTPYEPGYRIRQEHGDGEYSEYDLPEKAIIGHLAAGGQPHFSKGGLQQEMDVGDIPAGHIENTARNMHPAIGTRFEVDEPYGLAPAHLTDLYKHKGASALLLPWDSTSGNVAIRGISGHTLPEPVTSHGGIAFARMLANIKNKNIGASGPDIAKRVADRVDVARKENIKQGGTGQVLHMPVTMGQHAEGFSLTPAETAFQLHKRANLAPEHTAELEELVRSAGGETKPFRGFVGLNDPEAYARQIRTGEGLENPAHAGELRKAIHQKLIHGKRAQHLMDFNAEDVVNAMTDPALRGVPKGFVGSALMSAPEGRTVLTPSDTDRDPYGTRFSGNYEGTLGHNVPYSAIFGSKVPDLEEAFHFRPRGKEHMQGPMQLNTGDKRNMVLGALEKRKHGVSQLIDNQALDQYSEYLRNRDKWLRTGHYAEGGEVEPSQDEMLAHIMLHKADGGSISPLGGPATPDAPDMPDGTSTDLGYYEGGPSDGAAMDPMQYRAAGGAIRPNSSTHIGVDEAPSMPVKLYMPPGKGGMPVGGVDFQPDQPGQQMLPGQGQPPPSDQLGAAPTGAPQGAGMPQMGQAPQMPPTGGAGAPTGPQSNILNMTRQGQAMSAMRATPPPSPLIKPGMPRMKKGGKVALTTEQMKAALKRKKAAGGEFEGSKISDIGMTERPL